MEFARPATAFVFGRLHGATDSVLPDRLCRSDGGPRARRGPEQQPLVFIAELRAGNAVERFDHA